MSERCRDATNSRVQLPDLEDRDRFGVRFDGASTFYASAALFHLSYSIALFSLPSEKQIWISLCKTTIKVLLMLTMVGSDVA
jgi:hypothetical protein